MSVVESKARGDSRKRVKIAPHLFERAGRFEIRKEIGGKMHSKTLQARTRTEAKQEAVRELAKLGDGGGFGDRTITVEALAASFLEYEAGPSGKLAPRTLELRKHMLNTHVIPALGPRTKAVEVNAATIRRMIDKLVGKGYSGSMVRSCVSSASAMFSHGVRITGSLPRNPVRDLERGDLPSAKRKTEPRYLSLEEVKRLLSKMSDEFRPIAAACFWGALRVSEALTLRWEHIDFEAGTIDVPGTKSDASAATIRLHPALAQELRKYRERSARLGFSRIAPGALVFQTMRGLSPGRRNVHRAVSCAAEKAGLVPEGAEPVGVHDLRHSFAAYALTDARMSMLETSHILRHANPQVTATVYAGMSEDAKAASWDKLMAVAGDAS